MLRIVADQNIAHVAHYFSQAGNLSLLAASQLSRDTLHEADVLLVRSVTKLDHGLLRDSKVRWVGTMTSGTDHINHADMKRLAIPYASAPGCNANAVAEYVLSCIVRCTHDMLINQAQLCVGIIGYGHAGQRVACLCRALGWQVVAYDPPKALRDTTFTSATPEALHACDVVSVHANLHDDPPFPSRHLINKKWLEELKSGCIFINASRGDVCVEQDLVAHGQHLKLCLDVWQHEPNIDPTTLAVSTIATPHIAGHSDRAKHNATQHIYTKLCQAMQLRLPTPNDPLSLKPTTIIEANDPTAWPLWVSQTYDPIIETQAMHGFSQQSPHTMAASFKRLRASHLRQSFGGHTIQSQNPAVRALAKTLGFQSSQRP